jgi:transcriptional regulator GlxA family with amidase domain
MNTGKPNHEQKQSTELTDPTGIENNNNNNNATAINRTRLTFELFVEKGFDEFELGCIIRTLSLANDIHPNAPFEWRFTSNEPGMVTSANGMIVRAEPAIPDHGFSDLMIVVGGTRVDAASWLVRLRMMQRQGLSVVLLSDAATAYIRSSQRLEGRITTHWRDIELLNETGYYPNLSARLSESSGGIITGAGVGATTDLIIGLIASYLSAPMIAELGNRLLLNTLRKSTAEQPKKISDSPSLFDNRMRDVIAIMEDSISEPLPMTEITKQAGVSTRQLERVFREVFDESPARFYKVLRIKHARSLVEETLLPLVEVALASGFGSTSTMSAALRSEYGLTAHQMRQRKKVRLLEF